ncbi:MAG: hypothetical protein KBD63_01105 [Bacteriovoracaceae bacterium]|nr:hypothetical protein [Bacteriovoracaceae bacterium]
MKLKFILISFLFFSLSHALKAQDLLTIESLESYTDIQSKSEEEILKILIDLRDPFLVKGKKVESGYMAASDKINHAASAQLLSFFSQKSFDKKMVIPAESSKRIYLLFKDEGSYEALVIKREEIDINGRSLWSGSLFLLSKGESYSYRAFSFGPYFNEQKLSYDGYKVNWAWESKSAIPASHPKDFKWRNSYSNDFLYNDFMQEKFKSCPRYERFVSLLNLPKEEFENTFVYEDLKGDEEAIVVHLESVLCENNVNPADMDKFVSSASSLR